MKPTSFPLRVLVVDDHTDTLKCVAHLFRKLGYATATADCCASARQAAKAAAPDVVVCDVGLPDGDGIALLEELKRRYGIAGVALTAHVMPDDVKRYDRADIDEYLAKPAGINELARVVAALATRPGRNRRSA